MLNIYNLCAKFFGRKAVGIDILKSGGEGENRTHIVGFSDRCRDQLGYLTRFSSVLLKSLSTALGFFSDLRYFSYFIASVFVSKTLT